MKVKTAYNIEKMMAKIHIHSLNMLVWHVLRKYLNWYLPKYYKKNKKINQEKADKYTDKEVIVSLTTYPARMKGLPLVLETLFHQSVKPTKILLWLAENQYEDQSKVIESLRKYVDNGLEIRFCDDLRAHKKYYYTMKRYPEALVITVDDDILYPENMLELLLMKHCEFPNCIVTCRAHEMTFLNRMPAPYSTWNFLAPNCMGPDLKLCATGGAGCLYPPGSLSKNVFDKEVFTEICFYADDLWMKCMSYMNETRIVLTEKNNPEIITIISEDNDGLATYNVIQKKNDEQLSAVTKKYNINWEI